MRKKKRHTDFWSVCHTALFPLNALYYRKAVRQSQEYFLFRLCNLKKMRYNRGAIAETLQERSRGLEKKKTDVKFIVGMTVLVIVMVAMGASFWKVVAIQAEKDLAEEQRQEEEAIRAICVEAGDVLKELVFVDMDTKTVFKAEIPSEGIYNRNGKLIEGDVLENGDMVKIYGDNIMTRSIPAQYPGVTKMKRMGRATLEELEPYLEIVKEIM